MEPGSGFSARALTAESSVWGASPGGSQLLCEETFFGKLLQAEVGLKIFEIIKEI